MSPRYLVIWQDIAGNDGLKKWLLLLASFCTTLADGRPHTGGKFFFQHVGQTASLAIRVTIRVTIRVRVRVTIRVTIRVKIRVRVRVR